MKNLLVYNGKDQDGNPTFDKIEIGEGINLKKAKFLVSVNPFSMELFRKNMGTGSYISDNDFVPVEVVDKKNAKAVAEKEVIKKPTAKRGRKPAVSEDAEDGGKSRDSNTLNSDFDE